MNNANILEDFLKSAKYSLGTPILVIMLLAMMILPLPTFLLDVFFTFNIALSLVVLLACVYSRRPLDFSVFPTILLVSTLLRLALNIASTRVVLLHGNQGGAAAGHVIQSFGEVAIGNNFAVGLVVFAILVIINFVVVTKGAGRISEVSARFTLDAMPGKQMAIDADMNAGIINQEEAKIRRREVTEEADFYGSMDGASKFVRGDAIAGLLILFINIIGGIAIGIVQYNMTVANATHSYAILTIGDGLVAQVPSLLLSTAAAIMVTRVTSENDMGNQIFDQLFSNPKALIITSGIIGSLGMIPGMPHLAFLGFAGILAFAAYMQYQKQQTKLVQSQQIEATMQQPQQQAEAPKELDWDDVIPVDILGLQIGYRLINLVDEKQNAPLMSKIKNIRKKLSQQMGFLIPSVHIRDNLELTPNQYRITLMGVNVGETEVFTDRELAINPGHVASQIEGIACKDPNFGLDAVWIRPEQRDFAQSNGYTVVDACTVIATHLNQILQKHAAEILGHEEAQQLLDKLAISAPKLVEALVPKALPLSCVVRVLQNLLEENIPIVDIRTIAETLVESAIKSQDPDVLTGEVRRSLKRLIIQNLIGNDPELIAMTLAPDLEQILQQSTQVPSDGGLGIEPNLAENLYKTLLNFEQQQVAAGKAAILLVSAQIRQHLAKFIRHSIPELKILSFQEIPEDKQIKIIGTIGN